MHVALGKRLRSRWGWVIAVAAVVVLLASCAPPVAGLGATSRNRSVTSLSQISTLKSLFNRDDGRARLVLIFSPT